MQRRASGRVVEEGARSRSIGRPGWLRPIRVFNGPQSSISFRTHSYSLHARADLSNVKAIVEEADRDQLKIASKHGAYLTQQTETAAEEVVAQMRETPRSKANQHTCGAHGRGRHRCPRRIAPHLAPSPQLQLDVQVDRRLGRRSDRTERRGPLLLAAAG